MLRAYKYRIYPNREQRLRLNRTFGACRYIYNYSLNFKNKRYSQYGDNVSRFELDKILTFLKTTEEKKWLNEANSQALQAELRHLETAFTNFFRKNAKYPNFKRKFGKQSFECPQNVSVLFEDKRIKLPKIGLIKYMDNQTFEGKIKTCTVSMNKAGEYYVSVLVENNKKLPDKLKIEECSSIGIDVGLKHFATLSDGTKIDNPKYLKQSLKSLEIQQRRLSRKQKGSKNRNKQRIKVARVHNKISNQRKDFLGKLSTDIIKSHDTVFVEDLNIKGMVKNRKLARSISDVSWSEFFRMLEYKALWEGKNFIKIGRFEPSSKMCSCGWINKDLTLADREWTCSVCNTLHDRDLLASNNIKKFGLIKTKYNTRQGMSGEHVDVLYRQAVEA